MAKPAPSSPAPPPPAGTLALLWLALALTLPALGMRLSGFHAESSPLMGMLVFGAGIVAAAFVLTWGAEVAERDIGSGLAIVFLALVTVTPEYAVDLYFAWTAATDDSYRAFALANMTGANRLLIGLGWPVVAIICWLRFRQGEVTLQRDRSNDVTWLGIATVYSLVIPLKGSLAWYDALILFTCYALYVKGSKNDPEEHSDLVGPAAVVGRWPARRRRWTTAALFAWSAAIILAAAEPFAESLIHGGQRLGIDEFLLVQWLAPLASESPEFVVVILLTLRGRAAFGLGTLLSSKINQWTLLVGAVPLAYGLAHVAAGKGFVASMAIDGRQVEELWLTATQGLYATAVLADLRFSLRQALVILGLFLVQFVGSLVLESTGNHDLVGPFHAGLSILYTLLALERFFTQRKDIAERLRETFGRPKAAAR